MCEVTPDGDIIIGRPRPKNNPLIHRSVVGKPSFHSDLPPLPSDHTFGAALKRDPEGAGEVMLSWHSGSPTHKAPDGSVVMNKTRSELVESRHLLADPNRVYGRPSGDTSKNNMADLLQNRYELEWVNEQKDRYSSKAKAADKEKQRKAAPTRISIERNERMQKVSQTTAKPHPKEYFTLSQFKNVHSRYTTPSPTSVAKGYFSPALRSRIDCEKFNTNPNNTSTSATSGKTSPDHDHEEGVYGGDLPEQHSHE